MAYERRSFAGGGANTTVASGIDGSTLTITIADATGWPTGSAGEFFAVIDLGQATEEKVRIASRSSTTLTVASGGRGVDGTSGAAHATGAAIALCLTALDLDEANAHVSGNHDPAHGAATISFTSGGALVATDVGGALDELETAVNAVTEGLLASTVYNPATAASPNPGATLADVDATNLAVTFTAPPSGNVLVKLEALARDGDNSLYYWALREATTDIGIPCMVAGNVTTAANTYMRRTATFRITGLTPGASLTYKWSHRESGTGSQIFYGVDAFVGSEDAGPAVMEVWAA